MRERAIRFGTGGALVGVLTEPPEGLPDGPAIVFLNSGILHHVGASRLYVTLARRLAEAGFVCLRFDLAGIGDSEARRDGLGPVDGALRDGREALDWLQSARGVRRFVLVGLCSGSDMAFHLALADERVIGIANLDAWAYRTWRYYARRFGPKLLDASAWRHSLRVRLRNLSRGDAGSDAFIAPEYRRVFPPREEVEKGLRTLLERGLHIFHFFSGGMQDRLNHADQYRRSFPAVEFGDRVHVVYRSEANHTVTGLQDQAFVTHAVVEWIERNFGSHVPASAETADR